MLFISHAAIDQELAMALKEAICSSFPGAEVFVSSDPEDLAPGDPWTQKILDALDRTSLVLALTTERGLSRKWVWFESGRAWFSEVRLIPCCVGKIRKSNLPPPFSSLQGLNIDLPSDLKTLFGSLEDVLGQPATIPDFAVIAEDLTRLDFRAETRLEVKEDPNAEELRSAIKKKMGQLPTVQRETIRQLLLHGELSNISVRKLVYETGQDMEKFSVLDALSGETGWLTQTYRVANMNDQMHNAFKINEKLVPYFSEYFHAESANRKI